MCIKDASHAIRQHNHTTKGRTALFRLMTAGLIITTAIAASLHSRGNFENG